MSGATKPMTCSQCGEWRESFREGVCVSCWEDNQNRLDEHNNSFDIWERMSDKQRSEAIRRAGA